MDCVVPSRSNAVPNANISTIRALFIVYYFQNSRSGDPLAGSVRDRLAFRAQRSDSRRLVSPEYRRIVQRTKGEPRAAGRKTRHMWIDSPGNARGSNSRRATINSRHEPGTLDSHTEGKPLLGLVPCRQENESIPELCTIRMWSAHPRRRLGNAASGENNRSHGV